MMAMTRSWIFMESIALFERLQKEKVFRPGKTDNSLGNVVKMFLCLLHKDLPCVSSIGDGEVLP